MVDVLVIPILKRFCKTCKREFISAESQTNLCAGCGGPVESLPVEQPHDILHVYNLHSIKASDIAFLADNKHAVINSEEVFLCESPWDDTEKDTWKHVISLWDLDSFTRIKIYDHPWSILDDMEAGLSLSQDNRFALTGAGGSGRLRFYDLELAKEIREFKGSTITESVCISLEGNYAVGGDNDGVVWVWEISSGKCLHKLEYETGKAAYTPYGADKITHLVLLSNGDLISVKKKGELCWWRIPSGECLAVQSTGHEIQAAIPTRDDRLLISTTDGYILQWNPYIYTVDSIVRQSTFLIIFTGKPGSTTALALTADGQAVLAGGNDGLLRLIELSSGKCLRAWWLPREFTDPVNCLALAPDGRRALMGAGYRLFLWEWVEPPGGSGCYRGAPD